MKNRESINQKKSVALDEAARYRLISYAKTQLPDAVTCFNQEQAIPHVQSGYRVRFRRVHTPNGPMWDFVRIEKLTKAMRRYPTDRGVL